MTSIRLLYHARIRSWNQPVLRNKSKVSCSMKQRGPLMGLEPTTSTLRVSNATHCATPPIDECEVMVLLYESIVRALRSYYNFFHLECDYFGITYQYDQYFTGNDGCSKCHCGYGGKITCDNKPCRKCCQGMTNDNSILIKHINQDKIQSMP